MAGNIFVFQFFRDKNAFYVVFYFCNIVLQLSYRPNNKHFSHFSWKVSLRYVYSTDKHVKRSVLYMKVKQIFQDVDFMSIKTLMKNLRRFKNVNCHMWQNAHEKNVQNTLIRITGENTFFLTDVFKST
jgi:hypothetical protein